MERVDVTVVGAGVVGLAVASAAADGRRSVLVLERHGSFGRETSSRNSEVVHASIYYAPDSLKGRLCLRGNELMYDLCRRHGIPCANMGKLIVAVDEAQEARLPGLLALARGNGAAGVRLVGRREILALEPKVEARAAMHCPSSGVVDSHALMRHFAASASAAGASLVYNAEVTSAEKTADGFALGVRDADGEPFTFGTRVLVNCAGHGAPDVAAMAGVDIDAAGYRYRWRKGMYFRVSRHVDRLPRMLIYPVPAEDAAVGIHTCPDLGGGMRLGPLDVWVDRPDYTVDPNLRDFFFDSARPFLPGLERDDLTPDQAGVHPKIYGPGEPSRDFVIRHEADRGLPGLIDLIGIESPGLTSSPAIGERVAEMVRGIL